MNPSNGGSGDDELAACEEAKKLTPADKARWTIWLFIVALLFWCFGGSGTITKPHNKSLLGCREGKSDADYCQHNRHQSSATLLKQLSARDMSF
jgi:hypothetical protein